MQKFKDMLLPGKSFAKTAFFLAMPIILQNFIMNALNMMDIILLQGLGDTAVAAVSSANQSNQIVNLMIFGICSGSSIFLSQCRGSKDYTGMRRTVCIALLFTFTISFSVAMFMTFFPKTVMSLMTDKENLITAGAPYLSIVSVSFVLSGLSMIFSTLLRCNEKTKFPLFASMIALSVNTGLNYVLIYGKLGFPAMGVPGAAIATVISRIIELGIILAFVYSGYEKRIKPKISDFLSIRFHHIKDYFKVALAVIINELIWGLGNTIYSAIYGRMGETAVAAMSVATIMNQTFSVAAIGCGHVTVILLGQLLGKEEFDLARRRANTLALWSVLLGLVTSGIMCAASAPFVHILFNNLTQQTSALAIRLIIMFACFMPLSAFNFTNIVGTLRSGGDSLAAALLDVVPMYVFSIPLGIFLGLYLKLPPVFVISVMYSEQIIKAALGLVRVSKHKWVRKI